MERGKIDWYPTVDKKRCIGCKAKCPVQAISFPASKDFEHFVAYEDE
ncbi:hypothetical protein [Pelorhabdus rhamnosifermentans]|nr:hypothetical protein [Pelorhabdus rhamnosifermentans]